MPVFLHAIAVQFYRGIGPEIQYIHPFSTMNFFVGANNSGKSIVLNFIHERLPFSDGIKLGDLEATSADVFRGEKTGRCAGAVGVPVTDVETKQESRIFKAPLGRTNRLETLNTIAEKLGHNGFIWLRAEGTDHSPAFLNEVDLEVASRWVHSESWKELWSVFTNQSGGGLQQHWVPETISIILGSLKQQLPTSMLIPAKRQLGPKDETFVDLSGKGLIDHLAEIQNPDHHERERKNVFDQINEFVRAVTGKSDATLEVPSNRQHLLVHMDNKVLPLSSLGTGIHEVILIAAFCTIHQKKIMCIEEPEIHLHPVLQRKLIKYLQENTTNQYFIATHSAAFIDVPGASVFRVHNDGSQTYINAAVLKSERRRVVDELGYRASDIVQANAVVWVEGPSDRIYIRHWLNDVAPELEEGIHYSILFYGGGLISHLSADDDAVAEFIRLRELNRNLAIVIDSDKHNSRAPLKRAAQRLKEEMIDGNSIVWITKGREIENYLEPSVLHEALKACHPTIYKEQAEVGQYDHAFYFVRKKPKTPEDRVYKKGDKVGAALYVCEQPANLDLLDLNARIKELATMIRRANDLPESEKHN